MFSSRAGWVGVVTVLVSIATPTVAAAQASSVPTRRPPAAQRTGPTPSVEDLAKLKQNPLSGLREALVEVGVSPDLPESGGTAINYSLQLVWPIPLGRNWKVVSYLILPVVDMPASSGEGSIVGLGDALVDFIVTPEKSGAFVWGAGPAIQLPTRTDAELGSNRVALGPAAIVFYAKKNWNGGVLLQNVWSLGGQGGNEVNEFSAQYFTSYNLRHGWYLTSNATITGDWTADESNRWTLPVGGGFGKAIKAGKLSMSTSLQVFSNVVVPEGGADWSWCVAFSFLFP